MVKDRPAVDDMIHTTYCAVTFWLQDEEGSSSDGTYIPSGDESSTSEDEAAPTRPFITLMYLDGNGLQQYELPEEPKKRKDVVAAARRLENISVVDRLNLVPYCFIYYKVARSSTDNTKRIVRQWCFEDGTDNGMKFQDTYHKFANGNIPATTERQRRTNDEAQGRKGEFSVYTCDRDRSELMLLMECKSPRSSHSDDLVKLGNCMKDCVDRIARNEGDMEGITICGLISEGFTCRALAMDLKYHGIYRLTEIGTFYLPQSSSNFDVMLGAFQVMNVLQDVVMSSAEHCKNSIRQQENASFADMCLPSFDEPDG
ncbi:hypothetical protein BJV82DRAFT_580810 [Fennellomyces sp. T-0311]|nr:hypothetical protein BJV82DRAFT_580810 [Fennellomyces sp. T-0311]